ncbi:MAG: hypothetical protein GWN01_15170, partial [Nitrosopumilaceae archaeon]|nr:bifunctional DNA primase/polymerase [Nitrosopumilaceae archaeon]NIU88655.1 hypothetical protein [Nitrosopumilaceae archaeon]NIV66803.1 hypothetical protein [Nitrosopumilaceae archaeon]NIX62785.1 hypothetical protein [Nitrosopumilaceae archaeon]
MDIDKGGVEPAIVGIALREYAQNGLDPSFVITEEIKKNNLEAFIFVRQVKTPLECKGVYRYILTEIGDEPVTPTVTNYKSKITYLQDNLSKYKLSEFFINTKPYINLIQSKIDVLTGVKDEREAEKREKRKIQENARWAEWYRNQGWSIIPIETNGKKPIVNWKTYQEKPATKKLTKEWFRKSEENLGCVRPNIGVVCGKVSGITVMDIDTQEIEDDFINTYGDKYPIVKTGKGYHIYFPYNGEESRRINNYIEIKSNGCYIL